MIFSREFQYDRKVAKGLVKVYAVYLPENFEARNCAHLLSVNVGCNDDAGVEGIPEWTPEVFSLTSSEKRTNC